MNDRSIEAIKLRHPVLDVAREFTSLDRSGKGPCPRCGGDDRFYVHKRNFWACRKCRVQGGDVLDLVQLARGCTLVEAIDYLAGPRPPKRPWRDPDDRRPWQAPKVKVDFDKYTRDCEDEFRFDPAGRNYMAMRGFTPETLAAFRIGYKNPQGFVTIPWIAASGEVVAVKLRNIRPCAKNKRFRMLYGSQPVIFGAHLARHRDRVLIVEGEFNAMSCWQVLQPDSAIDVYSTGSESRQSVIPVLVEHYRQAAVWFDDAPMADRFRVRHPDLRVKVLVSVAGKDANDILVQDGADVLGDLVRRLLG